MQIPSRDNLYVSENCLNKILDTRLEDIVHEISFQDLHVVSFFDENIRTSYLVRTAKDVPGALKAKKGWVSDITDDIVGFISVDLMLSQVESVWLNSLTRGRGFGQGMYRLAHQLSECGINSSSVLCESSLSCLLKLYEIEPNMLICFQGEEIRRDQIAIKSGEIFWRGINLCGENTPKFFFSWAK